MFLSIEWVAQVKGAAHEAAEAMRGEDEGQEGPRGEGGERGTAAG